MWGAVLVLLLPFCPAGCGVVPEDTRTAEKSERAGFGKQHMQPAIAPILVSQGLAVRGSPDHLPQPRVRPAIITVCPFHIEPGMLDHAPDSVIVEEQPAGPRVLRDCNPLGCLTKSKT